MDFEPEIKAMQEVYSALLELDDSSKMRVINWVLDKFSLNGQLRNNKDGNTQESDSQSLEETIDINQY